MIAFNAIIPGKGICDFVVIHVSKLLINTLTRFHLFSKSLFVFLVDVWDKNEEETGVREIVHTQPYLHDNGFIIEVTYYRSNEYEIRSPNARISLTDAEAEAMTDFINNFCDGIFEVSGLMMSMKSLHMI